MVVAELAERLRPTPEDLGSNPDPLITVNCMGRTKIKKERLGITDIKILYWQY